MLTAVDPADRRRAGARRARDRQVDRGARPRRRCCRRSTSCAGDRFAADPRRPGAAARTARTPADARASAGRALVELPVGATADRVLGHARPRPRARRRACARSSPGLLAAAHRGILYVDEVNLLPDHLVDVLLDAAAMGRTHVERDGVSVDPPRPLPARGHHEPRGGRAAPAAARPLRAHRRGGRHRATRRSGSRSSAAGSPSTPTRPRFAARVGRRGGRARGRVAAARERLAAVRAAPTGRCDRIAARLRRLGVDGLRADIVSARAATALAALDGARRGRRATTSRGAARLALPHRRRRGPLEEPGLDEGELDAALDGDEEPDPTSRLPARRDGRSDDAGPDDGPDGSAADGPGGGGREARGGGPGGAGRPARACGRDGAGRAATGPGPGPAAGPRRRGDGEPGAAARTRPTRRRRRARRRPSPVRGTGRGAAGRRSRALGPGAVPRGQPRSPDGPVRDLRPPRRCAPPPRGRARARRRAARARATCASTCAPAARATSSCSASTPRGSMGARRRMARSRAPCSACSATPTSAATASALVTFRGTAAAARAAADRDRRRPRAPALRDLPTGGRTPLAAGLRRPSARSARRGPPRPAAPRLPVLRHRRPRDGAGGPAAPRRPPRPRRLARRRRGVVVFDGEQGPVRLGLAGALAAAAGARRSRWTRWPPTAPARSAAQ